MSGDGYGYRLLAVAVVLAGTVLPVLECVKKSRCRRQQLSVNRFRVWTLRRSGKDVSRGLLASL